MKSLYDADVIAWSAEQGALLRRLSEIAPKAGIDWDRVAQAVEAVGTSELRRLENAMRTVLMHAVSGLCDPDTLVVAQRRAETSQALRLCRRDMAPAARERLDLDRLWREGFDIAVPNLPRRALGVPPAIPVTCPFTLDELLVDDFTYDSAVERLYILLTSWRPQMKKENVT